MDSALFIGRFQPFHKGHLEVIKDILTKHDHVLIVIGSAQYAREKHNPYTAPEREEFIRATLKAENIPIQKYSLIPVRDTHDEAWYYHLQSHLPQYSTLYTGSKEVIEYFQAGNSSAKIVELDRIDGISATKIRLLIKQGKPIDKFVPAQVAELIKKWETEKHD